MAYDIFAALAFKIENDKSESVKLSKSSGSKFGSGKKLELVSICEKALGFRKQ